MAHIQQEQSDRDRNFETRTLAASLHGELTALLSRVHSQRSLILTQWKIYEAAAADRQLREVESPMMPLTFTVPVFESCIPKLGLLGPSVTADVVEVFSRATTRTPSPSEVPKFRPEQLARVYKALHEGYRDWGDEIVRVGARLGHLQGFGPDPGSLFQMRQAKESEKGPAKAAQ